MNLDKYCKIQTVFSLINKVNSQLLLAILLLATIPLFAQSYSGQFNVGGTSANYYPVLFNVKGMQGEASLGKLTVYRPNVHINAGDWAGTFHAEVEFIPSVWGNMSTKFAGLKYIVGSGNTYNDPIADIMDGTTGSGGSQLIIWFKGGAAYYWSATNNSTVSLADANEAGTSKTSSSGQSLPVKTEQSAFILKAKNNIHYPNIGISTDNGGYFGGNVGIGTDKPYGNLDVKAAPNQHIQIAANVNGALPGSVGIVSINDNNTAYTPMGFYASNYYFGNGKIGIGTPYPNDKLSVMTGVGIWQSGFKSFNDSPDAGGLFYQTDDSGWKFHLGKQNGTVYTKQFTIQDNGFVGIGTTTPDAMLTVKGKIHAREVIVDLNGSLADYVFSPDYSLMPLPKVEAFVKQNKHLPEIPSAAEVKEKGLSMGEMQNKLLQKIEELTLYVIEQQKQLEKQNAKIEELETKVRE